VKFVVDGNEHIYLSLYEVSSLGYFYVVYGERWVY
jgi:hypothetical protein